MRSYGDFVIRRKRAPHLSDVAQSTLRHGAECAAGAAGWAAMGVLAACSSGAPAQSAGPPSLEAAAPSVEASFEASGPEASVEPEADMTPDPSAMDTGAGEGFDAVASADAPSEAAVQADEGAAVDSAPSDAAADVLAPPCATAGTELCDDFESGMLDPKTWKINLGGPGPAVTVDTMHAHSGKYAVHAKVTPGQQSTAQITEAVTFPAAQDAFYTRIWAYFSPDVAWPATPPDFHTGFIIAGGNNDLGHVELAVGANLSPSSAAGPMHYLGYSIYRGPPYVEFGPRSQTKVTTTAWTCIELLESGQGGVSAVRRIWVDGTELPEQNDTFGVSSPMGQKPPQFNIVSIGIWEYHPTPSLSDMWIDDVRVSSQRIGCAS